MKPAVWIALAGVGLVSANFQDSAKKVSPEKRNLERWQGTFELASMVNDGEVAPAEELKKRKLTVRGNQYLFQNGDFRERGTYKFDLGKQPNEVDIIVGDGPDKGKIYLAIFDANDQRIELCFQNDNKKRPVLAVATPGSGNTVEVWRRTVPLNPPEDP
jgi:uncharacterized protein (TIGR03067 family)